MKKIISMVVLLLAALTVAIPASFAEGNYVLLKGGFYSPKSDDLKNDNFNNGVNLEGAFGHAFTRNFAGEAGIGFFGTKGDGLAIVGGTVVPVDERLGVMPFTVTGKILLPVDPVEFYVGGGFGAYFSSLEVKDRLTGFSNTSHDTGFGYHLLAGASADLNDRLFLGAEVKYLWAKLSFSDYGWDPKIDGLTTSITFGIRIP